MKKTRIKRKTSKKRAHFDSVSNSHAVLKRSEQSSHVELDKCNKSFLL